mmetsp:Transcript_31436/g.48060  ORF Transcript_31436/g.48060 Transcript_31436/m.48060 type:complete len:152 (+) Transcript_31436:2223-2678(+)
MQDEMWFTFSISFIIVVIIVVISFIFNEFMDTMEINFGTYFVFQSTLFLNAEDDALLAFCPSAMDQLLSIQQFMQYFTVFLLITALGYITSVIQKLLIISLKDNIDISFERIALEGVIIFSSLYTVILTFIRPQNSLMSDQCQRVMELSET